MGVWDKASSDKYRINPDFVAPEPTAATFYFFCTEQEYRRGDFRAALDGWRATGVKQFRCTLVNDEFPHEPYPHGVWFEGWTDKNAQMLPFGEAEAPGGPIYPPLIYDNGKLASGMSAGTAETQSGSGPQPASPTANEASGDAHTQGGKHV